MRAITVILIACILSYVMIWLQQGSFSWVDWISIILIPLYSLFASGAELGFSEEEKKGEYYILRFLNSIVLCYTFYKIYSCELTSDKEIVVSCVAIIVGLYNIFNLFYYITSLWLSLSLWCLFNCNISNITMVIVTCLFVLLFCLTIYFAYRIQKDRDEWKVSSSIWQRRTNQWKNSFNQLRTDYGTLEDMYIDKTKKESKWWKIWD